MKKMKKMNKMTLLLKYKNINCYSSCITNNNINNKLYVLYMLSLNIYKELEEDEMEQQDIIIENSISEAVVQPQIFHSTVYKWTLWAHLPHDIDWSLKSYKKIYDITTIEEMIAITETVPDVLVKNCMLFIMKDGITPLWEDNHNKNGGCFSYKISNKYVYEVWRDLTYALVGNVISLNEQFVMSVTGITISPKKNFCIIKIWMNNCNFQNSALITQEVKGLSAQGCLFKKHSPEF